MRRFTQGLILLLGFALAIPDKTCAASRPGDSCCLKEPVPACCCGNTEASGEQPEAPTHGCTCRIKSPRKGETPAGIPCAMPTALIPSFSTSPAERKSFRGPSFHILRFERGTSLHSPPPRLRLSMQQRFLI